MDAPAAGTHGLFIKIDSWLAGCRPKAGAGAGETAGVPLARLRLSIADRRAQIHRRGAAIDAMRAEVARVDARIRDVQGCCGVMAAYNAGKQQAVNWPHVGGLGLGIRDPLHAARLAYLVGAAVLFWLAALVIRVADT
jgi:hypothetical protein